MTQSSISPDEIAKFAAMAEQWWDPKGQFRPLHQLNIVRLGFIRDALARHYGRDPLGPKPLHGLQILDVGCGGGLLCEPLTRLGAKLTGIDAAEESIEIARAHGAEAGLKIDYRHASAETLVKEGRRFDGVLAMEVIEHVADIGAFMDACTRLVAPSGAMAVATLNRTPKSFALAIVGAEYVLRWVPRGTHDWRKFLRPSELVPLLERGGLEIEEITGVAYDPLSTSWRLTPDLGVNYMLFALKGSRR